MCSCNDPECPQCHVHTWRVVRWRFECDCGATMESAPQGFDDPRALYADWLHDKAKDDALTGDA